jgi:RES domain-containing protein
VALDVEPVSIEGTWLRQSRSGSLALPDRDPPPDNRWQRGSVVDALYLADEQATAWAEWYRHLAELGIPPDQWLPTYLWFWRVAIEVADLTTADRLASVGLMSPTPGRMGWRPFQEVGEALWTEGWAGLVAPSAARQSGLVLCLFRTGSAILGTDPQRPPRKITRAPAPPTGMRT